MPSSRGHEHPIHDFVFNQLKLRRFAMNQEAITVHPGGSYWSEQRSDARIILMQAKHFNQQDPPDDQILPGSAIDVRYGSRPL